MARVKNYITLPQLAERWGLTREAVRKMADNKVLPGVRRRGKDGHISWRYKPEDVEAFEAEHLPTIKADNAAIEQLKAEIEETRLALEQRKRTMTRELGGPSELNNIRYILLEFLDELSTDPYEDPTTFLEQRELDILRSRISGGLTLDELANKHNLTPERCRQLAYRAARKVGAYTKNTYFDNREEIRSLRERITRQHNSLHELEEEVRSLRAALDVKRNDNEVIPARAGILGTCFEEIYRRGRISVRALNILDAHDVKNIGDLVELGRTDVLKFRNMGRKTLTELEDLLEDNGLFFGMNTTNWVRGC